MPSMREETEKAKNLGVDLDTTRLTIKDNPNIEHKVNSWETVGDLASNDPDPTTTSATITFDRPPMPIVSLDPIKAELPIVTPKPHEPKKARMPSTGKKAKKAKRVKRPKGKKTRNLVTGGKNKTFRSTGTSKRKNRVIAGLTFWNSKD